MNPYLEAQKRVKKKRGFYSHFSSYVVMGAFFFILNYLTSPGNWWFHWPMLGWGIGIGFHYVDVFGIPGVGDMDKAWEKRAIAEELQKMGYDPDQKNGTETLDLRELKKQARNWKDDDLV
ncbi:MAG: 2TM domain-containing protein [Bacteroidota bacterium]